MQISTKALSVILLSFIGGSQTAHATPYEDAYGVTHYGFQCEDRVYTKPVIFAAAKNLCDKNSRQPNLQPPIYSRDGYRSPYGYNMMINWEASELFELSYTFTPIFKDGTLFAFESDSPKKAAGKDVRMNAGPDRLVVDQNCNIKGAFTDQDYRISTSTAIVKACRVLSSKEDIDFLAQLLGRSSQRSREHLPETSPERSLERSPETSPETSPERSRNRSPKRNLQKS